MIPPTPCKPNYPPVYSNVLTCSAPTFAVKPGLHLVQSVLLKVKRGGSQGWHIWPVRILLKVISGHETHLMCVYQVMNSSKIKVAVWDVKQLKQLQREREREKERAICNFFLFDSLLNSWSTSISSNRTHIIGLCTVPALLAFKLALGLHSTLTAHIACSRVLGIISIWYNNWKKEE